MYPAKFENLITAVSLIDGVTSGQMFGKPCIKINGKAFASYHNNSIAFKLSGAHLHEAMKISGASHWDPSGRGRPMKEWAALPLATTNEDQLKLFASYALTYVSNLI